MSRKPRIHFSGAIYHVMLRGNGGRDIFSSSADRSKMLFLLQEGVERFGHRIHAFCLMSNHVHLVMEVGEIPLSKIIQNLSFRYTRYVNAINKESGHLFQGRYKAILIDADSYLLQLVRYIHCNPVRAKLVRHCEEFQWSSHGAYSGNVSIPWLTTDLVWRQFADQPHKAIMGYNDFVRQGESEERRRDFHSGSSEGRILGDDVFVEQALMNTEERFQQRHSLEQIVEAVCAVYEISPSVLSEPGKHRDGSEARAVAAMFVLGSTNLKLADLAGILHRELSGLSQASSRLRKRLPEDGCLAEQVEKVRIKLNEMPNCQA
jgi:REP element-mobilizing transposase RayT